MPSAGHLCHAATMGSLPFLNEPFANRAALYSQAIDLALDAKRWPPLHAEGSLAFTPVYSRKHLRDGGTGG